MSSILDALKKSERQRSLGRDLIFRNASHDAVPRLTGFAVAVLVALVVLIVAFGALLYSLREPELPVVLPPAEKSIPTADAGMNAKRGSGDTTVVDTPAVPVGAVPRLESTSPSGSQTVPALSKLVPPKVAVPANTPQNPVHALPAEGSGTVPWINDLPASFRNSLPPLAVNIHVYSPDRTKRILYLNNRPVKQGEQIEGGVMIEEIVHDGVVLQYRGQRFKLPRPS